MLKPVCACAWIYFSNRDSETTATTGGEQRDERTTALTTACIHARNAACLRNAYVVEDAPHKKLECEGRDCEKRRIGERKWKRSDLATDA